MDDGDAKRYRALKTFNAEEYGRIRTGEVFFCENAYAKSYLRNGLIEHVIERAPELRRTQAIPAAPFNKDAPAPQKKSEPSPPEFAPATPPSSDPAKALAAGQARQSRSSRAGRASRRRTPSSSEENPDAS